MSGAERHQIYVALGGNQGQVLEAFQGALLALVARGLDLERVSSAYRTRALTERPDLTAPDYWNAVFVGGTSLSPEATLSLLHDVEAQFGRVRRERWAARTLDLDLLLYDGLVRDAAPILPHPGLSSRVFVLAPLAEVAPHLMIPVVGRTARQLLDGRPAWAKEILEVRGGLGPEAGRVPGRFPG